MKTLSLLPLALFSASLIACGDTGGEIIDTCGGTIEKCSPGGGGGGGGGGDRQHPTYTQQELRELGVVFPGDEGWVVTEGSLIPIGDVDPPWDGMPSTTFSRFSEFTADREWLMAFWSDITIDGYVCAPWHSPTSVGGAIHFSQWGDTMNWSAVGYFHEEPEKGKNTACVQTQYGAGMLFLSDLNEVIVRDDHSLQRPGGSGIAPTCHPTIDGIAFTRDGERLPVAYTVGSIFDARVPVSSCRD